MSLFAVLDQVEQYQGGRSHEDLKEYVDTKVKEAAGAPFGTEEETVPEHAVEVSGHVIMMVMGGGGGGGGG